MGNLIYAVGAILLVGGGLLGTWHSERNPFYDGKLVVSAIWLGAALLLIHAVFFMTLREFLSW